MSYSKAGCENPAKSSTSEVLTGRSSGVTGVQMPGDRTRKVSSSKAGQDVAGEQNQVKVSFSSASPGKQTWKGAADGYTTRSIPDYKASPAKSSGVEAEKTRSQQVKGKEGKRRAEAKSVAGKSGHSVKR